MSNTDLRFLEIYLNDHWAGATAGTAVADRLATNNAYTEWGERHRDLANEIEADETILSQVRSALSIEGVATKRALMMAESGWRGSSRMGA